MKRSSRLNVIPLIVVLGIFSVECLFAQAVHNPSPRPLVRTRIIRPIVLGQVGDSISSPASSEKMAQSEAAPSPVVMAPTRSSFLAHWEIVPGATGYRLDVSASPSFGSYAIGYHSLDVGNVASRIVSELSPGNTYYYRVRAYTARGKGSESDVRTATTTTGAGLVIVPTFDSSILGNPNSAAIQSAINQAVAIYQALLRDPITVRILFRYSNTNPNGTPLGSGFVGTAEVDGSNLPWNTYINALTADARTANDATANASLPPSPLSANMIFATANGRSLGFNTPGTMDATGNSGAGTFDGIVTLNSNVSFSFTRPPSASSFDAIRLSQGGIDFVLGSISHLDTDGSDLGPRTCSVGRLPAIETSPPAAFVIFRSTVETLTLSILTKPRVPVSASGNLPPAHKQFPMCIMPSIVRASSQTL